jgi:hypothetical protein
MELNMGTSSSIAILNKDGTIEQVNAHYDGNIFRTGAILLMHYKEPQKVRELISLGDISVLKREVHPSEQHSFINPQEDVTIFYARDRGDVLIKPGKFNSLDDYLIVGISDEHNYIFDEKKEKWFYVNANRYFITNNESRIAIQPLHPLVKATQDLMSRTIEEDFIEYVKQLKNERDYKKLQKELPKQGFTAKKIKI